MWGGTPTGTMTTAGKASKRYSSEYEVISKKIILYLLTNRWQSVNGSQSTAIRWAIHRGQEQPWTTHHLLIQTTTFGEHPKARLRPGKPQKEHSERVPSFLEVFLQKVCPDHSSGWQNGWSRHASGHATGHSSSEQQLPVPECLCTRSLYFGEPQEGLLWGKSLLDHLITANRSENQGSNTK